MKKNIIFWHVRVTNDYGKTSSHTKMLNNYTIKKIILCCNVECTAKSENKVVIKVFCGWKQLKAIVTPYVM